MDHPLVAKLQTLADLPAPDVLLLETLLTKVRSFAAHRDIISEGESPEHVILLVSGWACRYKVLPDGKRQITAFLLPGDFCDAHITLLRQMDHGIAALMPTTVALIPRTTMSELFDRPAIARALWWASLVDEGILREWIVNLGRRDSPTRVAHLICELYARLCNVGHAASSSPSFDCPLTQEDFGDALGLTPVHVNRTLRHLRENGLLSIKHRTVLIPDLAKLQRAAGFKPGYLHLRG